MNEEIKDKKLKSQIENGAYYIVKEGINYTKNKKRYKREDTLKLLMELYNEDFSVLSNDCGYREDIKMMASYFKENYHHNIITLEIIKQITKVNEERKIKIINDIKDVESILNEKKTTDIKRLLENEKYEELMTKIEETPSLKYAGIIVYNSINF